ncbi:MAG TPA: alkaline phosphatase PhoX, partial [Terriglobia bacterium]|nr:alkaline phosphatase PhoX [Terriglobia bacterium]
MNVGKWIAKGLPVLFMTAALSAQNLTHVPSANPRVAGTASPNILSPQLIEAPVAQGSTKLENTSALTSYYGYDNDGTMLPAAGALPTATTKVEATKTEPDKNTYLVLRGQTGADATYNYGSHFMYQGHELGTAGYITRINLDADGAHRITLMATTDNLGHALPVFDGSVWYPFSKHLLFSAEGNATTGGIWQSTSNYPAIVEDMATIFGRGGYEGMQADDHGNIVIVEDSSGATGSTAAGLNHAKRPNSYIYRFVPNNTSDLKLGGKMQVLQVASKAHSGPITWGSAVTDDNIKTQDMKDLHTYGLTFTTKWVTIHDTSINGFTVFDANGLARTAGGTPFKRPENGQFRPWSGFSEFFFSETGDTNALTEAGATYGGFGGVFRLKMSSGETGSLSVFYVSDVVHTGFDNCAFWTKDKIVFVEDAGDTLHGQRNALDSAYLFDVT